MLATLSPTEEADSVAGDYTAKNQRVPACLSAGLACDLEQLAGICAPGGACFGFTPRCLSPVGTVCSGQCGRLLHSSVVGVRHYRAVAASFAAARLIRQNLYNRPVI